MKQQNNKQHLLPPPAHRLAFLALAILGGMLVVGLLQFYLPPVTESLRWQSDVALIELWRLITGHFVHLSVTHSLLNAAAFTMIWLLFLNDWRSGDGNLMLMTLPLTSLLLLASSLQWYVGLSGVLHGWFMLGCIRLWTTQRKLAALMLLVLLLKLVFEPYNPSAMAEAELIGGPIAYVAHKLGVLAMVLVFSCAVLWDRVRGSLNSNKEL